MNRGPDAVSTSHRAESSADVVKGAVGVGTYGTEEDDSFAKESRVYIITSFTSCLHLSYESSWPMFDIDVQSARRLWGPVSRVWRVWRHRPVSRDRRA